MKRLLQTKKSRRRARSLRVTNKLDATRATPLNFKVPADFRREFKTYAAQNNKKLNQVLFEAFAALKAKHAQHRRQGTRFKT